jgi:hypothetical protein
MKREMKGIASAFSTVLLMASSGCATAPSDDSAVSSGGDANVVSGLLPIKSNYDAPFKVVVQGKGEPETVEIPGLFKQKLPVGDPNHHLDAEERAIGSACSPPGAEAAPLVGFLLSTIAEYIIGAASDLAQKEIGKYGAVYSAEAVYPFYRGIDSKAFAPRLAVQCLRFVRYDRKAERIRVDGIVQIQLDPSRDALQVRLLRVYFDRGTYEQNAPGHKVSMTASLAIDAVWFEKNRGYSQTVFSYQFMRATDFTAIAGAGDDPFHYFNVDQKAISSDWSRAPRLPLPPYSVGIAPEAGGDKGVATSVTYRISAAEAGPVPEWLKDVAGVLKAKKDDLSKLLGDALKKRLGVDSGSSSSGT